MIVSDVMSKCCIFFLDFECPPLVAVAPLRPDLVYFKIALSRFYFLSRVT